MPTPNENEQEVIERVRQSLADHPPTSYTLDVMEREVHKQNGWWFVPVRPSPRPAKVYEYYEVLAEVESELEEDQELKVLLVPSWPEE